MIAAPALLPETSPPAAWARRIALQSRRLRAVLDQRLDDQRLVAAGEVEAAEALQQGHELGVEGSGPVIVLVERHHLGGDALGAKAVAHLLARLARVARCGRQHGDPAAAQLAHRLEHRAIVGLEPAADDDELGIGGSAPACAHAAGEV